MRSGAAITTDRNRSGPATYDQQTRLYRSWLFLPRGNVTTFASRWDESAQTFTGSADLGNGITRTMTHRLIDRDTCQWTIRMKDRAGRMYLDISGTNRRRH